MKKTQQLVVTNKHGARFTVLGVESVPSAEGAVWCVQLRDSARAVVGVPMTAFVATFTKVDSQKRR